MDPLQLSDQDNKFRIVICMTPQRSHHLLHATDVQSDIAFKRVAGYKEFELVSYDPHSHSRTHFHLFSSLSFESYHILHSCRLLPCLYELAVSSRS